MVQRKFAKNYFGFITGDDLWSIRCGVLHNGRFGDLKHNIGRIIFLLPGQGSFVNCQFNDAYFYSIVEFCKNFTDAAYHWYVKNHENDNMKRNIERMMQIRTEGLLPYVSGMSIIA